MTALVKKLPIIFGIAILILGVVLYYRKERSDTDVSKPRPGTERYVSAAYGFSFDYPNTYFLDVYDMDDAEYSHRSIVLTQDNETNRAIREGRLMETESGPSVVIDIFQNNPDNETLDQWMARHAQSNSSILEGAYTKTAIGSVDAFAYSWDGLYRGDSIVFLHKGNIILLSGTYLERTDAIRVVFRDLVDSMELF